MYELKFDSLLEDMCFTALIKCTHPLGMKISELVDYTEYPRKDVLRVIDVLKRGKIAKQDGVYYSIPDDVMKFIKAVENDSTQTKPTVDDGFNWMKNEDVPDWLSASIPAVMVHQSCRHISLYRVVELNDVMRMKLVNEAKNQIVPLIGKNIRIAIGTVPPAWDYAESFTGYKQLELVQENGKHEIIQLLDTDVITVALE
jgi:hypothetical protein